MSGNDLFNSKKPGKIQFYFFYVFLLKNQAKNALGNRAELQFTIKDTKKYPHFKMACSVSFL